MTYNSRSAQLLQMAMVKVAERNPDAPVFVNQDPDDKLLADLGVPYVGMPATYRIGSDAYAGKLIAVSSTKHRVTWVRYEESTGITNTGMTKEFTRRRDGRYLAIGSKWGSLKLGVAKTDLDPGF